MTTAIQMTEIPPTPDRPGVEYDPYGPDDFFLVREYLKDNVEVYAGFRWSDLSPFKPSKEINTFHQMLEAARQ